MNFSYYLTLNYFLIFLSINYVYNDVPKLIVISFDAFRADYLHPKLTPFMYQLSKEGVSTRKMKSCYVTKTFPNHFSIVTGLYQENHGIISNVMFDPVFNKTFEKTNVEEKWWASRPVKPIWKINQQFGSNRKSGVFMWPGSSVKYENFLPEYVQKYESKLAWVERIDTIIQWMTNETDSANFILAYFNEPDSTSHRFGPFSPEVKNVLKKVDEIVIYLVNKLKESSLFDETNIIILSDHGMSEINSNQVVELENIINKDEIEIHGVSPNLNILVKDPSNIDKVYNQLKVAEPYNHYVVWKREDVPKQYHYSDHRRILDIVLEAEDGYDVTYSKENSSIKKNKSQIKKAGSGKKFKNNFNNIIDKFEDFEKRSKASKLKYWGNHGYNNSLADMQPLFLAHGPAFKKNYVHRKPFFNLDVYSLMCSVLNLNSNSNDNSDKYCVQDGEPTRVNGMLSNTKPSSIPENNNYAVYIE